MKYVNYIFIPLIALSLSTNAEVFKCKNATGKIIYQSEPCVSGATQQGVIKVKEMTPQEVEDSKARLKSWQEQQAADDAAKQEAERQRQAELDRQQSLELQRRSVIAQEQQAIAAQQSQNQPIIYGGSRYWNNGGYPPNGSWNPNMLPQQQPNIPWNHTPAGQAPFPMMPPPGQAPNPNGGGAGFHNR
jgi:hypothetical protein